MSCFLCNFSSPSKASECARCYALIPTDSQREIIRLTRDSAADTSSIEYQPLVELWIDKENIDEKGACIVGEFNVFGVKVLLIINEDGGVNVSTLGASKLNIAVDRVGMGRPTTVNMLEAKKM
jgi:hypothetical protein